MNVLQIVSSCNDAGLSSILGVIKNVLNLIQIIAPILLLIMTAIHLTNLMRDPDDKKKLNKVKNSALAAIIIFFIPMFVNVVFGMLGESTTVSSCWNNATIKTGGSEYIDPYGKQKTKSPVVPDPSSYEKGNGSGGTTVNGDGYSHSSGKFDSGTTSASGTGSGTGTGNRSGSGNTKANRTVFIGDSRTVQMYAYLNGDWAGANYSSGGVHVVGNDVYVAEGAMGLQWMKSTGIPAATPYFTSGTAIVILMGVNDLSNANNYISYVNQNASTWKSKGSSLYYVSVNPCNGSYDFLNTNIVSFNNTVKSGLDSSVGWIDTYSVLVNNGFSSGDGLHYDQATYQTIYNYIKSNV